MDQDGSPHSKLSKIIEMGMDELVQKETDIAKSLEAEFEQQNVVDQPVAGMCVECRDQPISGYCEQCQDDYCDVCFQALHRRGKRKDHKFLKAASPILPSSSPQQLVSKIYPMDTYPIDMKPSLTSKLSAGIPAKQTASFRERARYIPLRLELKERKLFRLLEAALNVSEYTDKVDVYTWNKPKVQRMAAQIKELCAILSGLTIANDFNRGQQLLKDHNYQDLAGMYQEIFEIGRRYKINNPDKMRSDFGKLMYLLQDSVSHHVQELLNFDCVIELKTVYRFLEERDCLDVLDNEHVELATREITSYGKTRAQVTEDIKMKEAAQKNLGRKYAKHGIITEEEIKQCLYSIGDNNSYLRSNRDCCDKMIQYLRHYFRPEEAEEGFELGISMGHSGARLTHSHTRQFNYVLQSLTLWRAILNDMYKLWYLAEQDLLDSTLPYRLVDTGQGLNRIQQSPRVYKAIHNILYEVQNTVRDWVGSSVIHLGDHNVPNAFFFLTKYLSVAPILNPIVSCIEKIEDLERDDDLNAYLESKGGAEMVKKTILADFFKHGFDGSGADNFFDAGSCIDGRLTSAWNWCSKIEKKEFFPVFLLTGFLGFDGES